MLLKEESKIEKKESQETIKKVTGTIRCHRVLSDPRVKTVDVTDRTTTVGRLEIHSRYVTIELRPATLT